jgi:Flp pilus assembly protein TadD
LKAFQADSKSRQHREFLHNHYVALAEIMVDLGESSPAIASLKQAVELVPEDDKATNLLARLLVTCPNLADRDPARAIELVKQALDKKPNEPDYQTILGIAYYRSGNWTAAKAAIERAIKLSQKRISADLFFLAMTDWHLGDRAAASKEYAEAVAWMEKNRPDDADLRRFRAEAEGLFGIQTETKGAPAGPPRQ